MTGANQIAAASCRHHSPNAVASDERRPHDPEAALPRVLIVDDNPAIHEDFRKILAPDDFVSALLDDERVLFGPTSGDGLPGHLRYTVESAYQGKEALQKVQASDAAGQPFELAFVDMRMPPGWDGVETISRLWEVDPHLQVVICTAYSDRQWNEIVRVLGKTDRLLILKKPFDIAEVHQLAAALTEKRRAQQIARTKVDELERLVAERTASLQASHAQLAQAAKMEAVGQLAAGVAHEFNNLLQSIQGYTQFAQEGLDADDPRRKDLDQVLLAAGRAAKLTRQLLSFGRRQILDRVPSNPNQLVEEAAKLFRPLIGEHIEVRLELAPDPGMVLVDHTEFQQILMNLCVNSRDAMPSGGELVFRTARVTLGTSAESPRLGDLPPGRYLALSVADTGAGMSPEVQRRIFEPFFTTKEVGRGTGLGLAMVYGLVQQHRGAIQVHSVEGAGTTFTIYLPEIEPQGNPPAAPPVVPQRGSETILVAEDELLVREFTVRVLQSAGYRTLTAANGDEAVRVFDEHAEEIDFALLDVLMPKRSGREVYQHIRSRKPFLPAVFCSGYDPETAQAEHIVDEGQRVLQKPVDAHTLLAHIRETLDSPCGRVAPQLGAVS